MSDSPFFDTNVLVYAFSAEDERSKTAQSLLDRGGAVGIQSLNEFVSVARRKLGINWKEIRAAVRRLKLSVRRRKVSQERPTTEP